jgi:hypothetical protein
MNEVACERIEDTYSVRGPDGHQNEEAVRGDIGDAIPTEQREFLAEEAASGGVNKEV